MTQQLGGTDFDFLIGNWTSVNRRRNTKSLIADPATNKNFDWIEFQSFHSAEKILDGNIILDHYEAQVPSGRHIKGITLRSYDPATQLWSIIWLDNFQVPDWIPLQGKFEDGIGLFYQTMPLPDGTPLHVRFMWDNISENTARWQQSFSLDEGQTWDTNWITEFSRN